MKGGVSGSQEAPASPFLSDKAKAEIAAEGRRYSAEEYLEAARSCWRAGEFEIVKRYFIEESIVFPSQLGETKA
jgi:hypothetical protein